VAGVDGKNKAEAMRNINPAHSAILRLRVRELRELFQGFKTAC